MARLLTASLAAAVLLAAGCSQGTSGCDGGTTACGDTCANLASDNANCGGCGNVCSAGKVCSNGACASALDVVNTPPVVTPAVVTVTHERNVVPFAVYMVVADANGDTLQCDWEIHRPDGSAWVHIHSRPGPRPSSRCPMRR